MSINDTAIDKAKGIVCKPMPKAWYDRSANKLSDEPTEDEIRKREFNLRILADKKPYFMRYIYPELMRDYNTYMRNADVKCLREFRISLADLQALDADKLTDDQRDFLR